MGSAEHHHTEDQVTIESFASITSNSAYNAIDSYSPKQSEENNSCSFIPVSDNWMDNNVVRDSTTSRMSDGIKEPWNVDHNYNDVPESGNTHKERMVGDGDACLSQDQSCMKNMKQLQVEKLVTDIKENVKKPKKKIKEREKWILKDTPRKKSFLKIKGQDEQGDECA